MDGTPDRQIAVPQLSTPAEPRRTGGRIGRKLLLAVVVVSILVAGGLYGRHWWAVGRFIESTDDAYVAADMVPVSSRLAGQIASVPVVDNQAVRAGDVLAVIDDRDLQAAIALTRADVASTAADAQGLQAQLTQQASTIAAAEADQASAEAALVLARADLARYTDLLRTGASSQQRQQQAEADIRAREAAVNHARASVAGAQQQVVVLQAQLARSRAQQARAQANARQAELNLSYATIVAPSDGAIGDRSVRAGAYVQPGTRLLNIVPMGTGLYVVANFKETQLARLGVGEAVDMELDQLPGVVLHGRVDSLAPGSGSTFALLPPENATGNFTKIVQRVPVRVRLDPNDALALLRPGLSVTASVDTRTAPDGPLQTLAPRPTAAAPQ